jgi:primosomal protein N' (replication factor Y)
VSITTIEVAVPVPLRQTFTYILPEKLLSAPIEQGDRVVVPFGARQLVGIVISCAQVDEPSTKLKNVLSRLSTDFSIPNSLFLLLSLCAKYYHYPIGEVFSLALPKLLRRVEPIKITKEYCWLLAKPMSEIEQVIVKNAKKQQQLLTLFNTQKTLNTADLKANNISKQSINGLIAKGLVIEQELRIGKFLWQSEYLIEADIPKLSAEQALVSSTITTHQTQFSCHLIEGITGSGKTEVYLQIMTAVLQKSRQVLLLVPEIGLTPQLLARINARFNVPIFLHHSGMNDTQRLQTWQAAKLKQAAIIIGTRSAVFSPCENLGLIIIDEEHDSSFKQQDTFRYHARDVAMLRAKQLNIPVVLGSATPCLETLHNALSKKYYHHQLTHRPGNSTTAAVKLIDMNAQPISHGMSLSLKETMKQTLAKGEQVLVFLNRRGFAPALACKECHQVIMCQHCDKPYTFHQHNRTLICHHCTSQRSVPKQCASCGSVRLIPVGQGTEQIEQYLAESFPDYKTVRIDRDSTRKKGELEKTLTAVENNEYQILIGTQMLAKGHHFPEVTLVAMLEVDGALFSYDFRAPEKLAQMIVQVSGRSGRASKQGLVLIQSYYPDHPLLQDLVNNGYNHFARQELLERKQAKLPPYTFQVLIRAESTFPSYPEKFLRYFTQYEFKGCQLAGPIPAAMEKKAGKYCFHLFIQADNRQNIYQGVSKLLSLIPQNELSNKVRWSIDLDPQDLTW